MFCALAAGGATVAATARKLGVHPRNLHRVGIGMIAAVSGQAALDPEGNGVTEPLEPDGGAGGVGGVPGSMNAIFLKDLADKTRRGVRGRVEQGKSGGGLTYGL